MADQPTYSNQAVFDQAIIGRVMMVAESDETPEQWHDCDGSTLASFRYPAFVERMGIQETTFTLPEPRRGIAGGRFIIKLGPKADI